MIPVEHQYIVTEPHPAIQERQAKGLPEMGVLRESDGPGICVRKMVVSSLDLMRWVLLSVILTGRMMIQNMNYFRKIWNG